MDDYSSTWLRLALCQQTPTALKRELAIQLAEDATTGTARTSDALSAWLHSANKACGPNLPLNALKAGPDAWLSLADALLSNAVDKAIAKTVDWAHNSPSHHVLTPAHALWPAQLHGQSDPPLLLYCIGQIAVLSQDQIAIVGARRASMDGKVTAKALSQDLSNSGWVITSGLAMGIDTAAHEGCLAGFSPTIAVMATDAATCYPKANRALASTIVQSGGCLITETPLGKPLERYCFPRRNRLISALSCGVVVVEAAIKSGTITTAKHAADQGREVMAVPGSVRNPNVTGCHQLIRDGATLVTSAADVVDCVPKCRNDPATANKRTSVVTEGDSGKFAQSVSLHPPTDSEQVATLLDAMGYDAAPLERLVRLSALSATEAVTLLTQLELQGRVTRDLAGRYSRC